jgi:hypothetical protein
MKTYLYQVVEPQDNNVLVDFGALKAADFNSAFEILIRRLVKLGHCGRTLPGRVYPVIEVSYGRFLNAGECINIEINVPDDEDWEGDGDEYLV